MDGIKKQLGELIHYAWGPAQEPKLVNKTLNIAVFAIPEQRDIDRYSKELAKASMAFDMLFEAMETTFRTFDISTEDLQGHQIHNAIGALGELNTRFRNMRLLADKAAIGPLAHVPAGVQHQLLPNEPYFVLRASVKAHHSLLAAIMADTCVVGLNEAWNKFYQEAIAPKPGELWQSRQFNSNVNVQRHQFEIVAVTEASNEEDMRKGVLLAQLVVYRNVTTSGADKAVPIGRFIDEYEKVPTVTT